MTTREKVLGSLEPVVRESRYVRINDEKLLEVAKELLGEAIPPWDNEQQLVGSPEQTAYYYFFLDSVNFCFWGPKGQRRWEYPINGEWVGGYYAYSRAIKDAFVRDPRFYDAGYVSTLAEEDFANIFAAGRHELLLKRERLEILRENFSLLRDRYAGSALKLLEESSFDTDQLVSILTTEFPTFNDRAEWKGQPVYFWKRAQILPSDMNFSGVTELRIKNLGHLTVFSDYKLPQILESFGVLEYASELDQEIVAETLIAAGSEKEVEIRANSVVACERLHEEMRKLRSALSAQELDWILWVKAKATRFSKPHHKTLATAY